MARKADVKGGNSDVLSTSGRIGPKWGRTKDLRHTFAVRSLQSGSSLKELTKILGHDRTHRTKSNYQGPVHGKAVDRPVCAACTPPNEALKQAAEKLRAMLKV